MDKEPKELALSPYQALDLTDEKGWFCGKILGDLGADVIKIEPPGGDPGRRIGPFYKDIPDPEKSLYWFAYNSNKRGITLNLETRDGKDLFKRLVKKADFVIESFPVGYMEELGLGYSTLSKLTPDIIMTSISHFGQAGPYRDYKGCDIVDLAMGNIMYVWGNRDRPPVRLSYPQAYPNAGAEAAAGSMIAFHHRQLTGEGQWVDVSIQAIWTRFMYGGREYWDLNRQIQRREGCMLNPDGKEVCSYRPANMPCKDGAVSFSLVTGGAGTRSLVAFAQWLDDEGEADDFLKSINWETFDWTKVTEEYSQQVLERFDRFFMSRTAAELFEGAKERKVMLYPVSTPADMPENPQLVAREFWEKVEHPELNATITYPGALFKSTETPLSIRRRAPLIGEHNEEVYRELGISREGLLILKQGNII